MIILMLSLLLDATFVATLGRIEGAKAKKIQPMNSSQWTQVNSLALSLSFSLLRQGNKLMLYFALTCLFILFFAVVVVAVVYFVVYTIVFDTIYASALVRMV